MTPVAIQVLWENLVKLLARRTRGGTGEPFGGSTARSLVKWLYPLCYSSDNLGIGEFIIYQASFPKYTRRDTFVGDSLESFIALDPTYVLRLASRIMALGFTDAFYLFPHIGPFSIFCRSMKHFFIEPSFTTFRAPPW